MTYLPLTDIEKRFSVSGNSRASASARRQHISATSCVESVDTHSSTAISNGIFFDERNIAADEVRAYAGCAEPSPHSTAARSSSRRAGSPSGSAEDYTVPAGASPCDASAASRSVYTSVSRAQAASNESRKANITDTADRYGAALFFIIYLRVTIS